MPGNFNRIWRQVWRMVADLGIVLGIIVAIITIRDHWSSSSIPQKSSPTGTAIVTSTLAPTATSAPPALVSLPELSVPGRAGDGVEFQAPQNGNYTFTIAAGAYSPWPGPSYPGYQGWTDVLFIYEDRPVQWGRQSSTGLTEPISPNAQLGAWIYSPTQSAAASASQGVSQQFTLKQGDTLTFIPIDQQGVYADNQGEVTLNVTFTP